MSAAEILAVYGGGTGYLACLRSIYLSDMRAVWVDDRETPLDRRGSSWWVVVEDRNGRRTTIRAVDRDDAAALAAAYVLRAIGVAP